MTKTGRLTISNEESRLDGTLLARKGAADPFGAATSFLRNLGLRDGDCISVSGENGTIGSVSVVFIDSASKSDESLCAGAGAVSEMMALRSAGPGTGEVLKRAKPKTKKTTKKKAKPNGRKTAKKAKPRKTTPRPKSKKRKPRRRP
jgi:hypothetical protein